MLSINVKISGAIRHFLEDHPTPEILGAGKLPSIDGLRGISILIVIIAHLNSHLWIPLLSHLFAAGIVGVYVFFVISGFLITTLLLKERNKTGTISLRKFYARRTLRIFPLAYLYILVIFLLTLFFPIHVEGRDYLLAGLYLANLGSFFQLGYMFHHYWSLAVEEQFYLVVAPIMKLPLKMVKIIVILILPATLAVRFLLGSFPESTLMKLLFDLTHSVDGLAIGSLAAFLVFSGQVPWNFFRRSATWLSFVLLALILLLKTEVSVSYLKPFFNHTFYSLLIAALLIINLQPSNGLFFRMLNSRVLVYIGLLSYSLYIWQQLFTSEDLMAFYPYNMLMIPATAMLSYHFFEKPFLGLKNRFAVVK